MIGLFMYKSRTMILYQYHRPKVAGAEGLEPSRTVLETAMLPLHHAPIRFASGIIPQPHRKCKCFFCNYTNRTM